MSARDLAQTMRTRVVSRLDLRGENVLVALLTLEAVLVYLISMPRSGPFDYYSRLADAFTQGRLWLVDHPSYLSELVACGPGRWCVHLAPLPALVVLPFRIVFDAERAQMVASAVAGALTAAPTYLAVRGLGAPRNVAVPCTVFAVFGTTLWFSASNGSAWYASHAVGVVFAATATYAALRGSRAWIVAALLGAALLARYPYAFAVPGLALLVSRIRRESFVRVTLEGALTLAPFAALLLAYNALRFGSPFETGYAQLTVGDPYFPYGLLDPRYVPRHIYAMLFQSPAFVEGTPLFVKPLWTGESLVLTSPALAFAALALARRVRRPEVVPLAIAAALPLGINVLHGTIGFAQFGYRYSLDFQPFLLPLVAIGACWSDRQGWRRPSLPMLALIGWSVLANAYGVYAISHLGYVG